jgi:hypothetical protein
MPGDSGASGAAFSVDANAVATAPAVKARRVISILKSVPRENDDIVSAQSTFADETREFLI